MSRLFIRAPASLLLAPELSPHAKLIYMVRAAFPEQTRQSTTALARLSGISRPGVRTALAQLAAAGWLLPRSPNRQPASRAGAPEPRAKAAEIPTDLLTETAPRVRARLLYGLLQLTPRFSHPSGLCSHQELLALTDTSPNTLRACLRELQRSGWLRTTRRNKHAEIRFTLAHPLLDRSRAEGVLAEQRLTESGFTGESLMREFLNLLVDSDQFEDGARPGFLVNPFTDERMEFDRFYPPSVALEFNGRQHYEETEQISAAQSRRQQGRDLMKHGICKLRGIELVVVHREDLTLEGMKAKVKGLLPLRDLRGQEPLIEYLETIAFYHRQGDARKRSRAKRRQGRGKGGAEAPRTYSP